jgi:hypothetical protein
MAGQRNERIDERDRGRRRLSRLTGWTATAAVALAAVFGVALASHDRAAAAPTNQNQVPDNSDNSGNTGGPGNTDNPDSGGGGVIQPPAQPPTPSHGSRAHVSSGGT